MNLPGGWELLLFSLFLLVVITVIVAISRAGKRGSGPRDHNHLP